MSRQPLPGGSSTKLKTRSPMIKANHRPFFVWFFKQYSARMINSSFREVCIHYEDSTEDKSVLMIGNHFSWWDGFFANYINNKVFNKKIHVLMLEEQLKSRMFLNKAGAFSIARGKRSVIETLDYSSGLLSEKNNMLVLYPQGVFQSLYQFPLNFEKGFMRILKNADPLSFQVVFYAALIDYFSKRKPKIDFYLKQHKYEKGQDANDLEKSYNDHLKSSINKQQE
jgi:1-acyl-sn-glycerol-3-phosphate acyltransferase